MPSADKFIPIAKYVGQLIAVIAAAILASVGLWWRTGDIDVKKPSQSKNALMPIPFLQREYGVASFSTKIRPLYMPIISMLLSAIFPLYVFMHMNTLRFLAHEDSYSVILFNLTLGALYIWGSPLWPANHVLVYDSIVTKSHLRRSWCLEAHSCSCMAGAEGTCMWIFGDVFDCFGDDQP